MCLPTRDDDGVAPVLRVLAGGGVSAVWDVHARVDCGGVGAKQSVFGAHLHSGVFFLARRCFWCARGKVGRMGLGIFSVWHLLRRGLGLVDLSGDAAAGRAFLVGAGAGGIRDPLWQCWVLARWRIRGADGAGGAAVIPLFGLWTCWRRLRRRQNWMLPMMAAGARGRSR